MSRDQQHIVGQASAWRPLGPCGLQSPCEDVANLKSVMRMLVRPTIRLHCPFNVSWRFVTDMWVDLNMRSLMHITISLHHAHAAYLGRWKGPGRPLTTSLSRCQTSARKPHALSWMSTPPLQATEVSAEASMTAPDQDPHRAPQAGFRRTRVPQAVGHCRR